MLFSTPTFGVFLALVVTLHWALGPQRPRARSAMLLGASYYFYACWDVRFLALIVGVTVVDYVGALLVSRRESQRWRRLVLFLVVGLNLGLLGFWKYIGFFTSTLEAVTAWMGAPRSAVTEVVLPVGVSFFTFQGLSYVIDVYRGDIEAERSLFRLSLFVAFFPQLVAGPIVRADTLIPQLDSPHKVDDRRFGRGLFLILGGLIKKVVLADYLAANLVDRVFDLPSHYSSLETLAAVYGYALQIYGDFSGYSDIAIGSALLLGVELPENFAAPYRADGLRDFWRRWHISLSTWLRDYLYIGLGGSRGGRWLTRRNLLLTMILGGLWHGASFTFLAWGALHGAALVAERMVRKGKPTFPRWARVLLTFHVVAALWVLFRAESFGAATAVFHQIAKLQPGVANLSMPLMAMLAAGYLLHGLPKNVEARFVRTFVDAPATAQAAATIAVLYVVGEVASSSAAPFIYFQF